MSEVAIGPAGEINGVCPALPSSMTAYRVVAGDASAYPLLVRDAGGRMVLVALGAWLAGVRGEKLVRAAVGGGLMIEAFVLWWAAQETAAARMRVMQPPAPVATEPTAARGSAT